MNVSELVELSGLVAAHAAVFIRHSGRISPGCIRQYWSSSKCRLDRWAAALREYSDRIDNADDRSRARLWSEVRPVLEEILASEVLTRVWTPVGCAYDQAISEEEISPVVRSVFVGHLEARNRALNFIISGRGFSVEDAVALNRLRRRCERWTDMLLGFLHGRCDIEAYAFDPIRAADFAEDLRYDHSLARGDEVRRLILASLGPAFAPQKRGISPSADLNRQIASSVLSCFRAEMFDSTGLLKSLWMERLCRTASDTQGMIEELLSLDDPSPEFSPAATPRQSGDPRRTRRF